MKVGFTIPKLIFSSTGQWSEMIMLWRGSYTGVQVSICQKVVNSSVRFVDW